VSWKVPLSVLREKGQITIPSEVRKAAHLEEGDPVDVVMTPEGILLRPRKTIDSTQAWFWTPTWQAREREASEDIRRSRVRTYKSDKDFLRSLGE
jgi:antitoxin PrlF